MAAFDEFVATAWSDHGERTDAVAERIAAAPALIESAQQVPAFVALLVHVYGEHLGQWQRGSELLASTAGLPPLAGDAGAAAAIARGIATLRFAAGDAAALDALSAEDRVRALATASSALAGRDETPRAIAAFRAAWRGEAVLPPGSPAERALAAAGNNLAVALEQRSARSSDEQDAMVEAARAALAAWKRAGTWLEEERAEYRLARSLLKAGRPAEARAAAERCLSVCARHDAPAFERFFAHAVVAFAQRAAGERDDAEWHREQALRRLEQVPEAEREFCRADLDELGRAPR